MKKIKKIIEKFVNVSLMSDKERNEWSKIYSKLSYQSIDYIFDLINYRVAYLKSYNSKNFSLIFYFNGNPIAIVPIIIFNKKKNNFDSLGLLSPSFDKEVSKKLKFEIFSKYLEIIHEIKKNFSLKLKFNIGCLNYDDYEFLSFLNDKNFKIIGMNKIFLIKNKNFFEKIFSDFRKSYKPLINLNIKKYEPKIMNYNNFDEKIWSKFRKLHKKIAGKVTRKSDTWNHQKKALLNNNAILVYLETQNKFLGFSFFYYTNDEAIYASAVFDEKSKNQKIPVGHLIQYEAIKFFIKKNIKNYKIANAHYNKKSSLKEENILKFKKGFANSIVNELILNN